MSLQEEVNTLKIQVNGDPRDNDDLGLLGESKENKLEISSLKNDRKWISGFIMFLLISASTYLVSTIRDGKSSDSNNNHSHNMDDHSRLLRGRQPDNNANYK